MKPNYKWVNKQRDTLIKKYLKNPHGRPPREIEKYLSGYCDQFAIATSYYFNLKLGAILEPRAIVEGNKLIYKNGIDHAFCFINSKTIFDTTIHLPNTTRSYHIVKEYLGLKSWTKNKQFLLVLKN